MKIQYAYSYDGDTFTGSFDSEEEAAKEAFASDLDANQVEVAEMVSPSGPESYLDANLLIEHILCQDDFHGDFVGTWPEATEQARTDLTEGVQKLFADWIEKHGLQPTHFTCPDAKTIYRDIE